MKTRVDDMLIEMIRPKIEEIERKFSNQEPLTQDDINTLLLKSQYNHINHLDDKLNETVEAVKSLEFKFEKLEEQYKKDFENLELKFSKLEEQYKKDFENLKKDFENLKVDIEATIQKALNKNMMLLITVIGIFLTIFKIIDKF